MTHHIHTPSEALARHVAFIWYSAGYRPACRKERLLPNGHASLIFNLDGVAFRQFSGPHHERVHALSEAIVAGMRSRYTVIDTATMATTMGVVLRPGGAAALLGTPARALSGDDVALTDVLSGIDVQAWIEQLRAAPTVIARIQRLEALLEHALDPMSRLSPAVAAAVRAWDAGHGQASVAAMVERTGYGHRRFTELFHDAVGVPPKTYARLRRFQHVLDLVHGHGESDWAELALLNGYCDQAHLIRDFRQFTGMTPTAYVRSAPQERNHVAE